ncbi:MAG: hypothetical protein V2B14_06315 [bacterium]
MKMNKFFIKLGIIGILLCGASFSAEASRIKWEVFNLTYEQKQEIQDLDSQWQKINYAIRPGLIRDQQQLKLLLTNTDSTDNQIRELQKQIFSKQDQLRYEALENFLSKRRLLTAKQRKMLQKMLSE